MTTIISEQTAQQLLDRGEAVLFTLHDIEGTKSKLDREMNKERSKRLFVKFAQDIMSEGLTPGDTNTLWTLAQLMANILRPHSPEEATEVLRSFLTMTAIASANLKGATH
jgi:hypothetical protein